ncbi:MAG: hypothetical protein AAFZ65_03005 [Planctomycetota bacterium]
MPSFNPDSIRRRGALWKRALWIALALPVGLFMVAFAIGSYLPATTEAAGALHFERPAADVFAALMDGESHPAGGAQTRSVHRTSAPGELPVFVEDLGETRLTIRTTEAEAPTHLVRELDDESLPMNARWTIDLEPDGEGTTVHYATVTTISAGDWKAPLFRVAVNLMGGAEAGVRGWIERAGAQ